MCRLRGMMQWWVTNINAMSFLTQVGCHLNNVSVLSIFRMNILSSWRSPKGLCSIWRRLWLAERSCCVISKDIYRRRQNLTMLGCVENVAVMQAQQEQVWPCASLWNADPKMSAQCFSRPVHSCQWNTPVCSLVCIEFQSLFLWN